MFISTIKQYSCNKIALILCALLHATLTCAFALTRLYTYKSSLYDIGAFDQILWNIIHHNIPLSTINFPYTDQNWLGFHFSLILFLLAPFYALWPHLALLQIVQSLCFASAGIILFYALTAAGAQKWEAWTGSLLYWMNPFVLSAAIWDFHEIAFSILFITVALWALCAKRFTAILLALLLLLLTKEHYGLSVLGFGLLWGLRYREWRRGVSLMVAGMASLVIIFTLFMPYFRGMHQSIFTDAAVYSARYSWISSPLDVLHNLKYLLFDKNANIPGYLYIILLLLSGLMLPLAAPLYVTAGLSDILANLMSANPMQRSVFSYHSAAIIPIIIIAAYQGYRKLKEKQIIEAGLLRFTVSLFIIVFCATAILFNPFTAWELSNIQLSPDNESIHSISELLPPGAIVAQSNIGAFFSQRQRIYPFPQKLDDTQAVILHLYNPFSPSSGQHFGIPYGNFNTYIDNVRTLVQNPEWQIVYWQPPWLVLVRDNTIQEDTIKRAVLKYINAFDRHTKAAQALQNP